MTYVQEAWYYFQSNDWVGPLIVGYFIARAQEAIAR